MRGASARGAAPPHSRHHNKSCSTCLDESSVDSGPGELRSHRPDRVSEFVGCGANVPCVPSLHSGASILAGAWLVAAGLVCGCAHPVHPTPKPPPVPFGPRPIDSATVDVPPVLVNPLHPPPVTRTTLRELIARDTLAVMQAVRACRGHQLLPYEESVMDGVMNLLAETRRALQASNLYQARSCSRSARQLARALECR